MERKVLAKARFASGDWNIAGAYGLSVRACAKEMRA